MQIEFQQAIEKHRQRVVTLARYSLRSAADADDIAQEVFVKLWQHWPKIDHDKQLPWLLRVTHNAIIEIAPLEGFLHQTNSLDALGYDEKEFFCDK